MSIEKCRILTFPKVVDQRGNLSYIQGKDQIPFDIARVYYLYDVPGGETRGGHAHRELEQVIIAISGSFDVELDDGLQKKTFHLRRADQGLYLNRMIWRELTNFASGSVCLVMASTRFDEADYYRDYAEFLKEAAKLHG